MHENQWNSSENRAPMIRYRSYKQLPLSEFDWPFQVALDENRNGPRKLDSALSEIFPGFQATNF